MTELPRNRLNLAEAMASSYDDAAWLDGAVAEHDTASIRPDYGQNSMSLTCCGVQGTLGVSSGGWPCP